jgi:hypothetical protein
VEISVWLVGSEVDLRLADLKKARLERQVPGGERKQPVQVQQGPSTGGQVAATNTSRGQPVLGAARNEGLSTMQRAAILHGFCTGVGLTVLSLRAPGIRTAPAFDCSKTEIAGWLSQLGITASQTAVHLQDLESAQKEPDNVKAAGILLRTTTKIGDILGKGPRVQLAHVNRIGWSLGAILQQTRTIAGHSDVPTADQVRRFEGLLRAYREPLARDIGQSGLPDDIQTAIRKTDISLRSKEDFKKTADACLEVLRLSREDQSTSVTRPPSPWERLEEMP